ncbi:MAG: hypothetical protein M1837_002004 [Sclerophora amabilis]|nr:MAG: hypothetical protein M1837_002004 [Sclerophora amabilis]
MNRFRTRRKTPKDAAPGGPDGQDDTRPSTTLPGKSFRRNKKKSPPPKVELDLAHALPSSDDFRTSLLMPNLSARFSMLREQDDPKSKLGKANDDSVLFSHRTSKFGGLADIAEVASIKSSIRPPFAYGRTDSYNSGDGYGTDDDSSHNGSVLSRSRPGEGNVLFGGRQKIYKIPHAGATSKGGKPMYENDVNLTAFQKLRERHREAERRREDEHRDGGEGEPLDFPGHSPSRNRPPSPPLMGYNRNRETSSSTNSGPSNGRTSTAATSINSQGATPELERSMTKSRRLYDPGLDQHLYDQQSSAMYRLDQLTRQRQVGASSPIHNGPGLSHAKSATNLHDRYDKNAWQRFSPAALPALSPPISAHPLFPGHSRPPYGESRSTGASPLPGYTHTPPLSPLNSEADDAAVIPSAIRPEDRGKATAMGAFNKPSKPYDDRQYSQRQFQLHQGRQTPPPTRGISPTNHAETPPANVVQRDDLMADHPAAPILKRPSPGPHARGNGYFQDAPRAGTSPPSEMVPERDLATHAGESFVAGPRGSELSATEEGDLEGERPVTSDPSSLDRMFPSPHSSPEVQPNDTPYLPHVVEDPVSERDLDASSSAGYRNESTDDSKSTRAGVDSPTLGPTDGLSGMIRQHLRTDSDKSSIFCGGQSPSMPQAPIEAPPQTDQEPSHQDVKSGSPGKTSNHALDPRAYKLWKRSKNAENGVQGSFAHRQIGHYDEAGMLLPSNGAGPGRGLDSQQQTTGDVSVAGPFGSDARPGHSRDPSTETQREREAFANELAQRRKMVQDNLKSFAEAESRSTSPVPGSLKTDAPKESPRKGTGPFGMLKTMAAQASPATSKSENPARSQTRGLGLGDNKGQTFYGKSSSEDHWKEEEERMMRGFVKSPMASQSRFKTLQQSPRDAVREQEQRLQTNNYRYGPASSKASSVSSSRTTTPRDRSSSDASSSARSFTRSAPQKDGLEVHANGASNIPTGQQDQAPSTRKYSNPRRPGAEPIHQSSFEHPAYAGLGGRSRSNSKASSPSVVENGITSPLPMSVAPPPPLPANPAHRPPPMIFHPLDSVSPSLHNSPSTSAAPTPTSASRQGVLSPLGGSIHHKRSINKSDISEPTFLSCTSNVSTVSLPPGATLVGGGKEAKPPPVPPINPRRRRVTTVQTVLGTLGHGRGHDRDAPAMPPVPSNAAPFASNTMEEGTASADEGDRMLMQSHGLRKSSSEGGHLNARARQQAMATPSPNMPAFPRNAVSEESTTTKPQAGFEGAMF